VPDRTPTTNLSAHCATLMNQRSAKDDDARLSPVEGLRSIKDEVDPGEGTEASPANKEAWMKCLESRLANRFEAGDDGDELHDENTSAALSARV